MVTSNKTNYKSNCASILATNSFFAFSITKTDIKIKLTKFSRKCENGAFELDGRKFQP